MGNLEAQLEGFAAGALWLYGALVILEALLELRGNTHFYRLKDTLCSIATGLAYTGVQVLMRGCSSVRCSLPASLPPGS